jgi:hypothetical protein
MMVAQSPEPPRMFRIFREEIKQGKNAAHEKTELAFVRAFSRANYPNYIAMETISGPSEAWFLERYDSYAALENAIKLAQSEPLKAAVEQADAQDGELRSNSRSLICVYQKELSYLPGPSNLPKVRFVSANVVRIRPGHRADFAEMRKLINAAFDNAGSKQRRVVYSVVSGAPSMTFIILSGMESLAAMDAAPAMSMPDAFGKENLERYSKLTAETLVSSESLLLAVNPRMSHPPKEYVTADPDFWAPKVKAVTAKAANAGGQ